jgi:hypothetical protein
MSHLQRTPDGRVIMPTFPALRRQLNVIHEEIRWLNENVLPALRNIGLEPGAGLNWRLILKAATCKDFLQDVPKRALQYDKYISFQGKVCVFRERDFYFAYSLTADGKERLAAIKEFEELPIDEQDAAVIESFNV